MGLVHFLVFCRRLGSRQIPLRGTITDMKLSTCQVGTIGCSTSVALGIAWDSLGIAWGGGQVYFVSGFDTASSGQEY